MSSPFSYTRLEMQSKVLKTTIHYGVLSLSADPAQYQETFYLLHGGNGDDQQFMQAGLAEIINEENLARMRARGVQIILPFIARSFLHGDYEKYFFSELIPAVELDLLRPRHIGGWSMGGLAALSAFFREPDLFRSVGAHFPTLIDFDFHNESQAQSFALRTRADQPHMETLLSELRREFPTIDEFKAFDPLSLARKIDVRRLKSKNIFFDVGSVDEFGLFEGVQKFHLELEKKGIEHTTSCVEQGHHDAAFLHARFNALLHSTLFIS